MKLYSVEPLGKGAARSGSLADENHLASRPFVTPDEEIAAAILDDLGEPWQYETRRFVQCDEQGDVVSETTIDLFLLWRGHPLVIEVKKGRIGRRHQRRLAIQAGYGFAYITGLLECGPEVRIQKMLQAIAEAEASWAEANHKFRSVWNRYMRVEQIINVRLVRVA